MCLQYECYLSFDCKYNHEQDIHINFSLYIYIYIYIYIYLSASTRLICTCNCHMCLEISIKCWQSEHTTARKVCVMK